MIERMKRWSASVLAAFFIMVLLPITAYAANARIAFSDPSATVGGQVSVTMKITSESGENLSSADIMLSYDSNALEYVSGTDAEGGAGAIRVHGDGGTPNTTAMSYTLTFNARTAGTTRIEVTSQEIYDANSQLVTVERQGNSTVTIGALTTASRDASLKSLQVSPGTLSPAFSPDIDTYAVTVGTDVEKIIVSAESTDGNATTIVSNNENLQMGENRVTCHVTAQDGETIREYVIVVTKAEGGASMPEGQGGSQIKLTSSAISITILDPDPTVPLPEGFAEHEITVNGEAITGWVWEAAEEKEYCVFYAMNEAGEKGFYRYDFADRNIQRYFQDPAGGGAAGQQYDELAAQYNQLVKDYDSRFIIIVVLAVIALLLLILFIWQIVSKNGQHPGSVSGGRSRRRLEETEEEPESEEFEPEELDDIEELGEDEPPVEPAPEPRPASRPEPAVKTAPAPEKAQVLAPEKAQTPAPEEEEDIEIIDLD